MNETLLAIIVVVVILSLRFLISRMPQPSKLYTSIISGILLLALVWFFAPDTKTALKLLMTVLVLSSFYRAYWDYKKTTPDHMLKGMQDDPMHPPQRPV